MAVNQRPTGDPAQTLRRIGEAGGQGFAVVADMRDPEQVAAMVHTVAERAGRLDYVVSNAAINPFMSWDETTVADYDNLFETNVRGTWVVCTEGAKQMIREGHGGAICCVSSISAHVGAPGQTAYCGTKGAISMLAKALGCDLGPHGIRVNAVEPGWVKTNMAAPLLDDPAVLKYYTERDRPPPGGRARGTRGHDRLSAVRRCQLRDLRDLAGGRRLHRERGAVGGPVARGARDLSPAPAAPP